MEGRRGIFPPRGWFELVNRCAEEGLLRKDFWVGVGECARLVMAMCKTESRRGRIGIATM